MKLITGVTGHIGRRAAELLSARGEDLVLLARDPDRAPAFSGALTARGDYADTSSLVAAMQGCELAFITSVYGPPGERSRLHMNAIDAAGAAGVGHIIYLSFQGASPDSVFPYSVDHWHTEEHLKASGIGYTILRDSFYLDRLVGWAGEEGVIRGPAGDGKVAWVAREDVAQVVAAIAANGSHIGRTLDVTGPEAFDLETGVRRLSDISGRAYRYHAETIAEGRAWRAAAGGKPHELDIWLGSYLAIAAGEVAAVSDTVENVIGRPPYTLEAYFAAFPERLDD